MKEFDVHGTVPVCVHITVKAENGQQAIKIAKKKFGGIHQFVGNGGTDKLIGVDGQNECITVDGNVEFDDYTGH